MCVIGKYLSFGTDQGDWKGEVTLLFWRICQTSELICLLPLSKFLIAPAILEVGEADLVLVPIFMTSILCSLYELQKITDAHKYLNDCPFHNMVIGRCFLHKTYFGKATGVCT